jgi:hypothetical protein
VQYLPEDMREVSDDLFISESEYPIAKGTQLLSTRGITCSLPIMGASIELDGELMGGAIEIQHEAANRVLAPKLESAEPLPAQ